MPMVYIFRNVYRQLNSVFISQKHLFYRMNFGTNIVSQTDAKWVLTLWALDLECALTPVFCIVSPFERTACHLFHTHCHCSVVRMYDAGQPLCVYVYVRCIHISSRLECAAFGRLPMCCLIHTFAQTETHSSMQPLVLSHASIFDNLFILSNTAVVSPYGTVNPKFSVVFSHQTAALQCNCVIHCLPCLEHSNILHLECSRSHMLNCCRIQFSRHRIQCSPCAPVYFSFCSVASFHAIFVYSRLSFAINGTLQR